MTGAAYPGADFFEDRWGSYPAEGRVVSRLTRDYPRKAGSILERMYDLRLALVAPPRSIAHAAAASPERRRVLVLGVAVPSRLDWMERGDRQARRVPA